MKINVARIKGWGKDENGLDKVIYLTEKQVDILGQMRNDSEKRWCFVKVGEMMFSPMDVMYIEEKEKELHDLPRYVKKRLEYEAREVIGYIKEKDNGKLS